jgi:hypothetical protein
MDPSAYDRFTEHLTARLAADERVLALIALGSTAVPELRDEHLSAHKYIAYFALDMLLGLLVRREPASHPNGSDPLDPWRRFEQTNPTLAAELRSAVRMPEIQVALRLMEITERELAGRVADFPMEAARAVRRAPDRLHDRVDKGGNHTAG